MIMRQSDIRKCPNFIIMPEHYRSDGSCKCNDRVEWVMAEWGYVWDGTLNQWVSGEEEE